MRATTRSMLYVSLATLAIMMFELSPLVTEATAIASWMPASSRRSRSKPTPTMRLPAKSAGKRRNADSLRSMMATAVYPPKIAALLAWLAVVAAAAILLARRGFARPVWLVPALAVVFQIPHAAIVWNGGPTDIARHAVLVGLMTRLGLLLLTIFLIDAALEARRSP